MTCFPEFTYHVYVDGEIEAVERRRIDAHLVGCQECRVLVSDLRDEARLLADTLRERAPNWQTGTSAPTVDAPIALGLPLAIALVTVAISVVGVLFESRWPGGMSLLNPLRLKGAFELAFDVVFMLRDRVPGLPELAFALGAVAGVSAGLSFAVGIIVDRVGRSSALLMVGALLVALPGHPASALDLRLDEDLELASGERIAESLVVNGDLVDIDGAVDGDLVVAAERVTIRGTVHGNVYALTRDLEILGVVTGSVHAGTERTRITGRVDGSVYNACDNFSVGPDGSIGRDIGVWADEAALDGGVARDVVFAGRWLEIRGPVGRDVEVRHAERLSLRDGARIGGDVDATLEAERIEQAAGAVVSGTSTRRAPRSVEDHVLGHYAEPWFYALLALRYAAAVVFGVLLFVAVPRLFDAELPGANAFFRALGNGFVVLVATPLVIAACALTVIGIPIAVTTAFVYAVALYSAKITVGAMIGRRLMGVDAGIMPFGLALLVGLGVLTLATALPLIGVPIAIVAVLFGLGTLYQRALDLRAAR